MLCSSPNRSPYTSVAKGSIPTPSKLKTIHLFTMRPLAPGDIRLLRIEAGTRPAPIRTTLEHVSLDSLPAYDALSYCWGPKGEGLPIICNNQKLFVGQNLFEALPFLRLAD